MKKLIYISSAFLIGTVFFTGGVLFAQTQSFPDVQPTDWFYNDVMNMVDWDVIRGNDDGTFKPSNSVNRAELSAMWNRYDQRVQGLIGGNISTSNIDLADIQERLVIAEYKISANDFFNSVQKYGDNIFDNPSLYCDNSNTLYEMLVDKYNNHILVFSPYKNSYSYIEANLEGVIGAMNLLDTTCDDLGYDLNPTLQ